MVFNSILESNKNSYDMESLDHVMSLVETLVHNIKSPNNKVRIESATLFFLKRKCTMQKKQMGWRYKKQELEMCNILSFFLSNLKINN